MEETLQQLEAILLRAVPTFVLFYLLFFYLKLVFFKPMARVMQQRYLATEGAQKAARESLERAAAKTAEYEAAMRSARAEVYQAQEQLHRRLQEREVAELTEARKNAEATIAQAKAALAEDTAQAKASLARDSESLANEIADSFLKRSAA